MIVLTPALLAQATGCGQARAERFALHLQQACAHFDITGTAARLAAFLAQIGHESGGLRYTAEIWGPTTAQARYEGRLDLGNTQPGDGVRFKGRGLIQTTGRFNHAAVRDRLRRALGAMVPDFEAEPAALEEPRWAAWSAADYWAWKGLNELADAGAFEAITRRINGGLNGQADRLQRLQRAQAALGAHGDTVRLPDSPPAAPAQPPEPQPETTMPAPIIAAMAPAFLSAAAGAIAEAVPKLGELFAGESPTAKRNVQAATIAVEVVKEALGARNEQDLVEVLSSGNPEAAARAAQAVEENWYRIHQAAEQSVAAARSFATSYAREKDVRIVAGNMTFLELLTLFFAMAGVLGGLAVLKWGEVGPELQGAIITLILVESVVGVRKFWFGNSAPAGAPGAQRDS